MVLSIPRKELRAALRPARHLACQMQLEKLEDRVVPSLADGAILVSTGPSSFSTQDQSSFPIGIIAVDPNTGAQSAVSTGGQFAGPTYIREGPNQQLYVTDILAFGTGAIFRVDPNTGQQSLVTKGGLINGPNALAYLNGFLYVANLGDSSGKVHSIVQVDPTTGQQHLITDGSSGGFSVPTGVTAAPGNNLYVVDEPGNVQGADPGAIWSVNLDTGKQTLVSHGGLLDHPQDIAVEPTGDLIVGNTGSAANGYAGSVIRLNPQTGTQTMVSAFGGSTGLDSLDRGADGTIYVGAISNGSIPGRIYSVNPKTGAQGIVGSGDKISLVEGIRVYHRTTGAATTADTTTAVVSSASPSVLGQSVTFTASISTSSTQAGTPSGTVQFQIDGNNAGSPVSVRTSGGVTTASFSTTTLTVGTHTIVANYSGDGTFTSSSGKLAGGQTVNPAATVLVDGTILVASSPLSGASAPTGIIAVNPTTGAQSVLSAGGLFSLPESVRQGPNGQLYVADYSASGTGAIIGVDPNTGQQRVVASGGNINGPISVAIFNGFLYVADAAGVPNLVEINLSTGQQRIVSSGGSFSGPVALAAAPNNSIYWADEYAFGGTGAIFAVNLQTGAQSIVTQGGLFNHMIDLGVDSNGNLLAYNASGSVIRIDAQTHAQSQLASGASLASMDGGTVDVNHGGTIFVSALPLGTLASRILAIDPNTGAQQTLSTGGSLSLVTGLVVYSKSSTATPTTSSVRSSVNASVFGQGVTFTATISGQGTGTPTGTVQFQMDGSNVGSPVSVHTTGGVTTASFTISTLTVGSHTVTVSYSGDGGFAGSTGTLAGGQTVNPANTQTMVVSSANPSQSGQWITVTATVTVSSPSGAGVTPTGWVSFFDGTMIIGQAAVSGAGGTATASITISSLSVGSHTITASYVGNSSFLKSIGGMVQTVNDVSSPPPGDSGGTPGSSLASTLTSLVVSTLGVPFGKPVILVATVNPGLSGIGTMTGSVTFFDRDIPLATVGLTGFMTVFTTSTLSPGQHILSVIYSGDARHASSSSPPVTVTVGTANERFLAQIYQSLLQRQPDAGGLAGWTAALNQGVDRTQVVLAIQQSPESRTNQVQRLYQQFLHRNADAAGLKAFVTFLGAGGTLDQVSAVMTSSPEYLQVRGGGTRDGFVTALYNDSLNRTPASSELAMYTKALNAGISPGQVATGIVGSPESYQNQVAKAYQEFLRRPADRGGLNSYVNAMRAGVLSQDNVAAAILGSEELFAHV